MNVKARHPTEVLGLVRHEQTAYHEDISVSRQN